MMSNFTKVMVGMALIAMLGTSAWAKTLHVGSADPLTESWTLNDVDSSATCTNAGTTPASWSIAEVADSAAFYSNSTSLVAADFSDPSGWTATIQMHLISNAETGSRWNTECELHDGSSIWAMNFNGGPGSPQTAVIASGSKAAYDIVNTAVDPTSGFHIYQIYYAAGGSSVDFYVDGTKFGTMTRAQAYASSARAAYFGDAAGAGGHPATQSEWALYKVEAGYQVVPEPSTLVLLLIGALALISLRRK